MHCEGLQGAALDCAEDGPTAQTAPTRSCVDRPTEFAVSGRPRVPHHTPESRYGETPTKGGVWEGPERIRGPQPPALKVIRGLGDDLLRGADLTVAAARRLLVIGLLLSLVAASSFARARSGHGSTGTRFHWRGSTVHGGGCSCSSCHQDAGDTDNP